MADKPKISPDMLARMAACNRGELDDERVTCQECRNFNCDARKWRAQLTIKRRCLDFLQKRGK